MNNFPAVCEDCENQKLADIQLHHNIQGRLQTLISQKHEEIRTAELPQLPKNETKELRKTRLDQLAYLEEQFDQNEFNDPYYKPAICVMHANMGAYLQNIWQRDLVRSSYRRDLMRTNQSAISVLIGDILDPNFL
jgi:hypothetical protein